MSVSARLTRKSGTSFYYAFRLLPAPKRRAIYALYYPLPCPG
jgi:phytoene/squalene synthetase